MKPYRGPPMTLGTAAAAGVRLIVWCKECRHQVEPDPIEMAARYGAETAVLDWRERLVCSQCGGRQVDMVLTGNEAVNLECQRASLGGRVGTETPTCTLLNANTVRSRPQQWRKGLKARVSTTASIASQSFVLQ